MWESLCYPWCAAKWQLLWVLPSCRYGACTCQRCWFWDPIPVCAARAQADGEVWLCAQHPTSPTARVATWLLVLAMIQDSLRKRSEFWAVTGKGWHAVCLGDVRNSFVHHLQHLRQLDWKHFYPSLGWNCDLTFVPLPISKQALLRELLKSHRHCSPSAVEQQSISYLLLLLPSPASILYE